MFITSIFMQILQRVPTSFVLLTNSCKTKFTYYMISAKHFWKIALLLPACWLQAMLGGWDREHMEMISAKENIRFPLVKVVPKLIG